jgi:alpha-1,2-mannosyltransferase
MHSMIGKNGRQAARQRKRSSFPYSKGRETNEARTPTVNLTEPDSRLTRRQWVLVASLFATFLAFGAVVELRSAFLSRRMGDLGVYLRAGWAVRSGADLYTVTDDNDWHYNYPPLFAILMAPLADPPHGSEFSGAVPYPVAVAIFYALNLVLLFAGTHALASALESCSAFPAVRSQGRFGQRWWLLRAVPVLVCLPPIGHTLMRGQANIVLLALVCGFAAALLRGRRHLAGWFLAGAITLKIFPAYLLLYPLWRRDFRCLAGCGLGLAVGLVAVPVAALGPQRTMACYRSLADGLVLPALGQGGDHVRDDELIKATRNDSQSIQCVIHKTINLDPATRPEVVSAGARQAHRVLGVVLTLLTLMAAGWQRLDRGPGACLFVGALSFLMMALSPVCHTHYFALSLPLAMGLLAADRERRGSAVPGIVTVALLALNVAGNALPLFPPLEILKDTGAALYAGMLLWLAACMTLKRQGTEPAEAQTFSLPARPAAA